MAHIKKRERADGTVGWQVRIPSPNERGKRIVKTFERKRDAERWLSAQASAINSGDFIDPRTSARPFRELVETWKRTRVAKLAPKTRERYDSVLRTYLLPEFGATPIGRLGRPEIKEWFSTLDASPATARKVQIVLSSILSEGVELGLIRENPATRLRLATPPRRDMTVLTAAEIRALAEAIERPSDRLAVYVAAYTGLRAGELWALRRQDVDLTSGQPRLVVGRTLTSESGHLIFRNATKTDGSRRVVSLPTFLANMLATHLATLPAAADSLVFTSPGGGGTSRRREGEGGAVRHELFVRRAFRPAVTRALPPAKHNLRWHDLRHTCASLLIHSGASVLLVQKRLGHSSATTTLDRYGWLFPSAEAALADALDVTYADGNVIPLDPPEAAAAV